MTAPVIPMATLIDASAIDYLILIIYFGFVLGIGFLAKSQVSESMDFFLSGRSLPAWVTGLAFISANLGAVEIMGMSANGADFGLPAVHYFWVGAIPAMLFLGVVMMPFYYGSKVRSVPEFMLRRFGTGAHLVNAISFAVAQLLIAGVNLYLLGSIVHALLGWPLPVALVVAAAIVLSYITLGGLSAAIYNEVLQFFIIVAALAPLTFLGLHRVGGWDGLTDKITKAADAGNGPPADQQLNSWPGQALSGFDSSFLSVIGIVFGLGFVLSFGYWTTNFVEVQRAMASDSISSARKTPIIGAFPKMFIPFITIIPGMIAAVLVTDIAKVKAGESVPGGSSGDGVTYNDSLLLLMRKCCPTACSGWRSPACWRRSWPAWPPTSRPSTRSSPTTCGPTTSSRTGPTTTTCGSAASPPSGQRRSRSSPPPWRRTSPTSWTTYRSCSGSSTRRCSRPSSSACSGSG